MGGRLDCHDQSTEAIPKTIQVTWNKKKTGLEDKQFTLGLFDYFREGGYDVFIGIPPRNHRNALCLRL